MSTPQVPRPRRRLTQDEFEREAARARGETPRPAEPTIDLSEDGPRRITPLSDGSKITEQWERREDGSYKRMVTRTGRRRSWWQRGWKR